ncbi:MAG: agmatine deiminase family protein [Paludibacter sp.]|nr:agmatine deiminase family protein [Paludibacter sp.]
MSNTQIFFPPEWAKQEFVQLTFPHAGTDWANMLDEVQECFCEIIRAILRFENVLVVCADNQSILKIEKLKEQNSNYKLQIVNCFSNDTWARDHAAITVFENNRRTLLDFTFNGWGLKFAANYDNLISSKLFSKKIYTNFNYKDCRNFILEGGSIETDGAGTILTTEKCLLSENRNYLNKSEIEDNFKKYFGIIRVLWLKNGSLTGDDTDSHIDTLARFCNQETIAYVKCEDTQDSNYQEFTAMENELKTFRTLTGKPYNLVELPMANKVEFNGKQLPATYANFLIINNAVLLPIYNSPKDKTAFEILKKLFPKREIIPINCLSLIKQGGSLHCSTMQFPKNL